jgi:protein TonB
MRHIDPLRGAVMFEESLLESSHLIRTQSRWPAFASFGLQAAIAAVIVIVPILHPEVVPLHAKLLVITAPPLPTTPPPPPPKPVHVEASAATSPSMPEPAAPTQAPLIQTRIDPTRFSDDPPPNSNASITGTSMVSNNNPLASLAPTGTSSSNIVVAGPVKRGPLAISSGVSAGLLLAPIRPIYPPIAKAAHVEGTVTVHAIISKTGTIESASATSGPMMLQQAALEAIRIARYRPYLLNGLPTEVDTTFVVNFRLGS